MKALITGRSLSIVITLGGGWGNYLRPLLDLPSLSLVVDGSYDVSVILFGV